MSPRARLLLSTLLLAGAAALAFRVLLTDLPSLDRLTETLAVPSTKILARDGRPLYEILDPAGVHHTTVPLEELPPSLRQATVATEDASFYTNPGVDAWGILRAVWINLRGGEVLSGGSTLTQQIARNMLLDPQERAERTLTRKLRETILAWRLARAYSKDELLALYLNQTYYGHLAYGVEAAARTYFGKSARDLDLAESALLAGLPQAPSLYDPLIDLDAAKARQAVVLGLMRRAGAISDEAMRSALAEPLQFASEPFPIQAPHFVFYVWNLLERRYGPEVLYSGLTVTTTLDLDLTLHAQAIARRQLEDLARVSDEPSHNATDAALVALDPTTGQILAMVGSPDYFDASISGAVNMALAPRQPGSAIKPVTYAAAFDPERCPVSNLQSPSTGNQGLEIGDCPWTPATMILDVKRSFVTKEGYSYVPQNYDRRFHGPVSARQALASSLNVPAVIALDHVGLPGMIRLASDLGITTLSDAGRYGLALTLGGGEVRLLDLTAAFGAFANGGRRVEPAAVLRVVNAEGQVLDEWRPRPGPQVLDPRIAYLVTDVLSDNAARAPTFGLNSVLRIGRPAAVKTGTTTDFHDNWTVGYVPSLVSGVWIGNADNSPMRDVTGVTGAGPIWHDFMRAALRGKPEQRFDVPPGLVRADVCSPSGLRPTELCPHRRTELFLEGTVPAETDVLYQLVEIDSFTGALADANTPPERVTRRLFLVLPPEAQEWARAEGIPQPPDGYAGCSGGPCGSTSGSCDPAGACLLISSPDPNTVFHLTRVIPAGAQQVPFRIVSRVALAQLTFELDGRPLATLDRPPFEHWWPLAPGQHTLRAIGVNNNGQRVESAAVRFTVLSPPAAPP